MGKLAFASRDENREWGDAEKGSLRDRSGSCSLRGNNIRGRFANLREKVWKLWRGPLRSE